MATEESLQQAAQAWCDPRTEHLEMDAGLAEVFAETLDVLKDELHALHGWRHDYLNQISTLQARLDNAS